MALRCAVFGVLLRAMRAVPLRARVRAGLLCRVAAGRRRLVARVSVCQLAAQCCAQAAILCNAGHCVACVVPRMRSRRVNHARMDNSSCAHAGASRGTAARRRVRLVGAFVGAVCHCGHTALQPALLRACGGQGVARARCCGRVRARQPPACRVAAWPASACWAIGRVGTPCFFVTVFFWPWPLK